MIQKSYINNIHKNSKDFYHKCLEIKFNKIELWNKFLLRISIYFKLKFSLVLISG